MITADVRPPASPVQGGKSTGLERLLQPLRTCEFFARCWDRAHVHLQRSDPSYFFPLVPVHEMEFLLAAGCGVSGAVEAFSEGRRTQICTNPTDATDAFDQGISLRISNTQRFSANLAVLSLALEQQLSAPVSVNAYLSPPGCRALARHYDSHDVIVAQLRGSKRWRIYDGRIQDPVENLPLLRADPSERKKRVRLTGPEVCDDDGAGHPLLDEFVLHAGDTLYLPRGFFHEAQAEEAELSWHLTFGIHSFTYIDLLTAGLAEAAKQLPELRQRLPWGFAASNDVSREVSAQVLALLPRLAEVFSPAAALAAVASSFHESRRTLPLLDRFASRAPLGLATRLRLRPGALCRVEVLPSDGGDRVQVHFGSLEVSLPSDFESAVRKIAAGMAFVPRDLPGNITDEERIALAEKFLQDGLLALASDSRDATR